MQCTNVNLTRVRLYPTTQINARCRVYLLCLVGSIFIQIINSQVTFNNIYHWFEYISNPKNQECSLPHAIFPKRTYFLLINIYRARAMLEFLGGHRLFQHISWMLLGIHLFNRKENLIVMNFFKGFFSNFLSEWTLHALFLYDSYAFFF